RSKRDWSSDVCSSDLITGHLTAGDFLSPRYGQLYAVIADLITADEPHHPTRVLAALTSAGRMAGHHGRLLADALQTVTLLGTPRSEERRVGKEREAER